MKRQKPEVGQTWLSSARDRVTVTHVTEQGRVTFADNTRSYMLPTPVFMACAKLIVRHIP